MNFPPTAATGREALCVAVELGQTSFMQLKTPQNTSHIQPERVRIAHGPERLGAASGTDLVRWRTLNLHISTAFIIFSRRATTLTQGLFVSVFFFLLCPSNPPHRPHTSTLPQRTHLASSSAEEYHCINGSLFCLCVRPFFAFSFGPNSALAYADVCHPHENLCLSVPKRPNRLSSQLILQLTYPA